MGEAPKNKDTRYHPYQAPSACEARRDLTAASLVWPELRVERLRVFGFTADEAGMWRLHRRGFGFLPS